MLVKKAYENSDDLNYMADKINTITKDDLGQQAGIYTASWIRSAIVDQALTMKAIISNVQGNGEYQIVAVPPKGATVKIDGKAFIRSSLTEKQSFMHNVSIDCKVQDPIFEDLGLSNYGRLQLWNIDPKTGYADVMLSQTRLSCDSGQRMAAGLEHKMLLDNEGQLWSWGDNSKGQLGTGVSNSSSENFIPRRVDMPDLSSERITHIAAGGDHSIALDNNAKLWAWGDNTYGQLGNGSNNYDKPEPVDMTAMSIEDFDIVSIAVGREHSLALDDKGVVWSWGRNNNGQLGIGNRVNKTTPIKTDLSKIDNAIIQLAAGDYHTLALDAEGNLWSWGDNTYGQLGNGESGTTKQATTPVKVNMTSKVVAVAAGDSHNIALDSQGRLWSWEPNYYQHPAHLVDRDCYSPKTKLYHYRPKLGYDRNQRQSLSLLH